MGGGALMTPMLVLLFHIDPLAAVSSDLVVSLVMKPVGAGGGLVVGMTSVGSGSLIIVALMLLYPRLTSAELVGTDLVQAIPLVGSAALGHLLFGQVKLDVTGSLLLGGIPGIWLGAHVSSRAPDRIVKPVLFVVLMATGLKLVGAI